MTTVHYVLPFILVERQNEVEIWEVSHLGVATLWRRSNVPSLVAASVDYDVREVAAIISPPTTLIYKETDQEERRWQIDIPAPLAGISVFTLFTPTILYTLSHPVPNLHIYAPILGERRYMGKDVVANPPLTVTRNKRAVSCFVTENNKVVWRVIGEYEISPSRSGHVCNPAAYIPQYCASDDKGMLRIATIEDDEELATVEIIDCSLDNAAVVWGTVEEDDAVLYMRGFSPSSPSRIVHIVVVLQDGSPVWGKVVDSPPTGAFIGYGWYCFACGDTVYHYHAERKSAFAYTIGDGYREFPVPSEEQTDNFWLVWNIGWRHTRKYVVRVERQHMLML